MRDSSRFDALPQRLPDWFRDAPLGIFIHWGAYSVPAWAEPTAELGAVESDLGWFAHNPYAEWYFNTIRIEGSPAAEHHQEVHGGAPYDDFLDQWVPTEFDPAAWADLFRRAGADYVVPTTKHHDGITLWDAPGTGDRNTVQRGPRRDLVGEIARATTDAGLRFGVYYSGGLDWHVRPTDPLVSGDDVGDRLRPRDDEYGTYCSAHVRDLIDRYQPDVFWNDIGWPDENFHFDEGGLGELLEHFYAQRPEGLINDRFAGAHQDFVTTEYQAGEIPEGQPWENCRGIGLSFGYNQVEDASQYMSGAQAVRHVVDAVSKGGRVLLNVGPRADGTLPELQVKALEALGEFMAEHKAHLAGSRGLGELEIPGVSWARAVEQEGTCYVFLSGPQGRVSLSGADLPVGYDWPAEGVEVDLAGEESAPIAVSAPRTAGAAAQG
ncbi:MAG: alpha-L-fucosidase, partial [Brachybacterium alimentarium]|uniref:alpha-L-fucosidase n=1 Tax=Brachybacterium alimentarium TaxID=47845 RepID=A0A2A3YMY0_9MICO|nr:alpha-L-fucosidase [Brachybacterium alimentarium]PCC30908.1 alpha-L-fucosidase [Brachybacterium alimentarium]PCC40641.1 alpha-L-fucosidase [Brachybacterium alimentarium]RCS84796.1 alpha-L-fucosidase [Brachybacterium alimentarium]RCS92140.1 alpha-L-fucosidase [Brachybacterium alimentarium]